MSPTIPTTGVGKIEVPLVSLYKETFPDTTGVLILHKLLPFLL